MLVAVIPAANSHTHVGSEHLSDRHITLVERHTQSKPAISEYASFAYVTLSLC